MGVLPERFVDTGRLGWLLLIVIIRAPGATPAERALGTSDI